jgi:hypothetical protein
MQFTVANDPTSGLTRTLTATSTGTYLLGEAQTRHESNKVLIKEMDASMRAGSSLISLEDKGTILFLSFEPN